MKKILAMAVISIFVLGALIGASFAEGYGKQKVVYHIDYDDVKHQISAMRNIQNHIDAVGADKLDLRVVMHAKGYTLLKRANSDPNFRQKVANLKKQGVKMLICATTIRRKKINVKNDLYDVDPEDIVPSGVAEIAQLQKLGYSYVKP
ncbi:MAG: DsrE family protein [Gammaproteobacteria bacterium]|nr:MAG: DsrE family protein [Gammaproteobacteria bacterium]